jgi:60S ribosomal subunit assembly/export protein LOC1
MMKARQMEEIREARKEELAKKQERKKEYLDKVKGDLRKKRKRGGEEEKSHSDAPAGTMPLKQKKKTVSFA